MTKWERFLDIFYAVCIVVVPVALIVVFLALVVKYDNEQPIEPRPTYFETFEHDEMKFTIVKRGSNRFLIVRTNGNVAITNY